MSKKFLYSLLFILISLMMISFFVSKKEHQTPKSMAILINGKKANNFPTTKNYQTNVVCKNEGKLTNPIGKVFWLKDKSRWSMEIINIQEPNTICEVTFSSTKDPCQIPGYLCYEINQSSSLTKTKDQDGESYYYNGEATDNYLTFAGINFRIIRINGDKSIRLITSSLLTSGKDTITAPYNSNPLCNQIKKVTDSVNCAKYSHSPDNIYNILNEWYQKTITGNNKTFIHRGKYCNDLSNWNKLRITYFGNYARIEQDQKPNLECNNHPNIYNDEAISIIDDIGLLSVDEARLIGTENSYLTDVKDSWTISPKEYVVSSNDQLSKLNMYLVEGFDDITTKHGLAPVINLNSLTIVSGVGTIDNPYLIIGVEKT